MTTIVYKSNTGFTEKYAKILELISIDGDYVGEENFAAFLAWYSENIA